MENINKTFIIFWFIFIIIGHFHSFPSSQKDSNIIGAPVIFYTPETNLALGVAGSLAFNLGEELATHPSTISSIFYFTLNKQMVGNLLSDFYFSNNRIYMSNFIEYKKFPNKFYGIGNDTKPEDENMYDLNSWEFLHTSQLLIFKNCYLGPAFRYYSWETSGFNISPYNYPKPLLGLHRGVAFGFGLNLVYDSRNVIFTPNQGYYLKIQTLFYHTQWGSEFTFSNYKVDFRKYLKIQKKHILALRIYLEGTSGDVPFLCLPQLGGSRLMRGYYTGRFRDKLLYVFQTEYRLPLFWRIGVVIFAALGDVVPRPGNLLISNLKYSFGIGIRYLFNKDKGLTLRLDQGFTSDSGATYIEAFEAY